MVDLDKLKPAEPDVEDKVQQILQYGVSGAMPLNMISETLAKLTMKPEMSDKERKLVDKIYKDIIESEANPFLQKIEKKILKHPEIDVNPRSLWQKLSIPIEDSYNATFKPYMEEYRLSVPAETKAIQERMTRAKNFLSKRMFKSTPHVIHGQDVAAALHELAHADPRVRFQSSLAHLALPAVLPAIGAYGLYKALKSKNREYEKYAPYLAALAMSGKIPSEAAASIMATKNLIKEFGISSGLKKALPLLPSFMTYAAMPIVGFLGTKKALESLRNKEKKKLELIKDQIKLLDKHEKKASYKIGKLSLMTKLGFINKIRNL